MMRKRTLGAVLLLMIMTLAVLPALAQSTNSGPGAGFWSGVQPLLRAAPPAAQFLPFSNVAARSTGPPPTPTPAVMGIQTPAAMPTGTPTPTVTSGAASSVKVYLPLIAKNYPRPEEPGLAFATDTDRVLLRWIWPRGRGPATAFRVYRSGPGEPEHLRAEVRPVTDEARAIAILNDTDPEFHPNLWDWIRNWYADADPPVTDIASFHTFMQKNGLAAQLLANTHYPVALVLGAGYLDRDVVAGRTYSYRVEALLDGGRILPVGQVTVMAGGLISVEAPTDLVGVSVEVATPSPFEDWGGAQQNRRAHGRVHLRWSVPTRPDGWAEAFAAGYDVWRRPLDGDSWLRVNPEPIIPFGAHADEPDFFFVDDAPALQPGQRYRYVVAPRDLLGRSRNPVEHPGQVSNAITATPPDRLPPVGTITLMASVPPTNDRVVLSWTTDITETVTYHVYKTTAFTATLETPCTDLDTCWKTITTTTGTSFTDTSVAFDTPYWYRVQAADAAGNLGPLSEPVSAVIHDRTPPDPPEVGGTPDAFPEGEWVPAWLRLWPLDPSDVAGYLIWRQFQGDPEPVMVDAIPSTGDETVYTSTLRLPFSQMVTYTVQAVDAHGNVSRPSDPVAVSQGLPIVEAPPKPIITEITTLEGGDHGWTAEIHWEALDVPGLSQFQVYRFPEPGSVPITVAGPGERSALDTTVQPGILYTYAVAAVRETESGPLDAWSEPVQYKVLARRGRALSQFTLTAWLDPHGAPVYLRWTDITTTVVPEGRRYLVFRSIYPDRGFIQLTPPIAGNPYVDYVDTDADQSYWYVVLRLNPATREVEAYAGPVQATRPTGSSTAARPAESLPLLRPRHFQLNQLPTTLLFGGDFQVQVTSYDPGATLSDLSGYGNLLLLVEGEQRVLENVRFEHLQVELIDAQTARVTAGTVPVTTGLPVAVDLRPDGFAYQLTELTLYPVGIVPLGTIRLELPPSLRWVESGVRRSTVDLTAVVHPALDFQGSLFLPPQDCVSPAIYLRMETLPWRVVPQRFDATPYDVQLGSVCTLYDERFSGFPTPDDPYRNDGLLSPTYNSPEAWITPSGLTGPFGTPNLVFYTAAYPYGFQVMVTGVVPNTSDRVRLELEGSRIAGGSMGSGNIFFEYYSTPVGPGTPDAPDRFITADFDGLIIGDGGWLYGEVTTTNEIRWNGFRLRSTDGTYELYIPPIQTARLPQDDVIADWPFDSDIQPGLNVVRSAREAVEFGWWPCTDSATQPPLDLGGTPEVDVYVRRGGVSDTVEVGDLPPGGVPLNLYGYDVTLTSFGFSFYDNLIYDSNTNGELFLGGPSQVGLRLNGMITDANGCVIRAQPGAANVILDYWQVFLNLDGVEFRDEPLAPGGKLLWLLGSLVVPHVGPVGSTDPSAQVPVPLEASFNPDGTFHRFNLIQTAVHFTLDGFDWVLEGIRLSQWAPREQPSWDSAANLASPPPCFPADPFDPNSPCLYEHGFVEMVGKMAVPFFGTVRQADDDPTLRLQVMVEEKYVGFAKRPKAERKWTVVTDIKFGYQLVYAHHHDKVTHRGLFVGFRKDDIKVLKVDSALVLDSRLPEGQGLSTAYLGLSSGIVALRGLAELTQPTLPMTLTASLSETMQTAWFPKIAGPDGPPDAKYLDLLATVWPTITVAGGYTQTTQVLNDLGASIPDEPLGGETLVFTDTARMWKIRGDVVFDPVRDPQGFVQDYELGELRVSLKLQYGQPPSPTPRPGTPTPTPTPTPVASPTPPPRFLTAERLTFVVNRDRDFLLQGQDVETNLFRQQVKGDFALLISVGDNPGFEGGVRLRNLELESLRFEQAGAALGIRKEIYYLGAFGDAELKGGPLGQGLKAKIGGAFLVGQIDTGSPVLRSVGFGDLLGKMENDTGSTVLTGFYVRGYGDFPIYNKGCMLAVNAGGEAAVWYFNDRDVGNAYSGRIRGFIHGELLCVVSARGDLTLELSHLASDGYQFEGTAWIAGGLGSCEPGTWVSWETRWWDDSWCWTCGAFMTVTYNKPVSTGWEVDYDAECE